MPHLGLAWCPTLRKFDRPIPVPSYLFLSIFDIPGLQTWRIDCRFWCRSRGAHGGLLRHSSWSFSSVRGRSGSGAFGQSKGYWMHSCRFQQGRCCQTNPCYAWRVSEFFHMWFESSNKGVIFLFYATLARKLIGVWMVWHFSDSSSWLEWLSWNCNSRWVSSHDWRWQNRAAKCRSRSSDSSGSAYRRFGNPRSLCTKWSRCSRFCCCQVSCMSRVHETTPTILFQRIHLFPLR